MELGVTKSGQPRQRREKLSAHVRRIEHNVLMHIKRDVRHSGKGWSPLILDTAWNNALQRLLKDGIVQHRPDLGGYVPSDLVSEMEAQNAKLQAYVKQRYKVTGKPVKLRNASGRTKATALGRLVISGALGFHPDRGYTPLD